jgi:hypothetical protein
MISILFHILFPALNVAGSAADAVKLALEASNVSAGAVLEVGSTAARAAQETMSGSAGSLLEATNASAGGLLEISNLSNPVLQ